MKYFLILLTLTACSAVELDAVNCNINKNYPSCNVRVEKVPGQGSHK